jgi:proline utilization trans-activator
MTPVTSTLADACLHTARHSNELLTQLWIEGALSTFGYFDAHYLFSSAVILAISSISDADSKDKDRLDSAAQLLRSMADSGNLSATEFCGHLDQVRSAIDGSRSDVAAPSTAEAEPGIRPYSTFNDTMNPLTTEMALLGQPMQDFITQAEFPFEFPNPVDLLHDTMLLFT